MNIRLLIFAGVFLFNPAVDAGWLTERVYGTVLGAAGSMDIDAVLTASEKHLSYPGFF